MGVAVFQQHRLLKQVMGSLCPMAGVCWVQKSKGTHSEPGEAVTAIIQLKNGRGSEKMTYDGWELVIGVCNQWDLLMICKWRGTEMEVPKERWRQRCRPEQLEPCMTSPLPEMGKTYHNRWRADVWEEKLGFGKVQFKCLQFRCFSIEVKVSSGIQGQVSS